VSLFAIIGALIAVFTVCGSVLLLARMELKSRRAVDKPDIRGISERLDQMQQAIDAIALETERISEGQRYTTKLLSEKPKDVPRGQ